MSRESFCLAIDDASRVAEGRRIAVLVAEREGMPAGAAGNAAIVATELASNLWKHAQRGELHIVPLSGRGAPGIEMLSIDRGPGMSNPSASFEDGHSTAGTAGTGLGAVRRLSDEFDLSSKRGVGTILVSQLWANPANRPAPGFKVGVAARPLFGESQSGDSWAIRLVEEAALLMVADGLGHGVLAADASGTAVEVFNRSKEQTPANLVQAIHAGLRGTRGAAVAVARVEWKSSQVLFAGLGNINGVIVAPAKTYAMVSHNGTAGHEARQIKEFVYPWTEDSIIVMHSDGVSSHWNAAAFPGLRRHHPSLIGGLLYREAGRDRDDACVVVGKMQ